VHETSSCLISHSHRPLDLHRYPRPLFIQASPSTSTPIPPSVFTHSRHQTVRSPHPKMRPFLPVLPYRTRHLGTTASPLRHMTEIRPTIILPRKQAATSWSRPPPKILEKIPSDRWRYPRVSGLGGSFQERSERKERG
jgi:hypothetical protein